MEAVDAYEADIVGIAQVGERVDVEVGSRVDGGIEHKAEVAVPVAVDILRTRDSTTSLRIISGFVGHGVSCRREVHKSHHSTLMLLEVVVIKEVEVLREGRIQFRITFCDAQRVTVIPDRKQVGHRGLLGTTTIGEAQLTCGRLLPAEVERRRKVSHVSCNVKMLTLIIIEEVCLLRKHLETYVEVIGLANDTQHHLSSMVVVLILRHTAQCRIHIVIKRIGQTVKIGIPITILGLDIHKIYVCQTISLTVTLGITILVGVAELEIDLTEDGLAVSGTDTIAPAVFRCHIITIGDRRVQRIKQEDIVVRHRLAHALTPVAVQLDGDVPAVVVQTTIELQHTTDVLGVTVADTVLHIQVLDDVLANQRRNLSQRVGHIFIRILILHESGTLTGVLAILGVIAGIGAEHDVCHRVRLPLQTHLSIPLVGTGEVMAPAVAER